MKQKETNLHFTTDILVYPLLFVFLCWLVFWFETRFNLNLNYLGILPQKIEGLRGVIFGPFIHSSLKHLFNNSIPLLVLGTTFGYFYRYVRWRVFVLGFLLTGLLTWCIGRPALHIGASGVVYMLAAFLFFKGIFSRRFQLIAISLIVVFLYGSLVWYLFPIDPKISWEGHLSGFIVGLFLALIFKQNPVENKKYDWEKEDYNEEDDIFLQHFDADGNFIASKEDDKAMEEDDNQDLPKNKSITITYTYRKSDGEK